MNRNLQKAMLGGVPGTKQLVKSYLKIILSQIQNPGFEVKTRTSNSSCHLRSELHGRINKFPQHVDLDNNSLSAVGVGLHYTYMYIHAHKYVFMLQCICSLFSIYFCIEVSRFVNVDMLWRLYDESHLDKPVTNLD